MPAIIKTLTFALQMFFIQSTINIQDEINMGKKIIKHLDKVFSTNESISSEMGKHLILAECVCVLYQTNTLKI